ncbi:hypothetical protein [Priestia taiwanensis]|uniref:Lipoprotein n=1 Tax=Priestia taiwanensis TaxID=1347902 RepID=A0A917ER88_9BACI|nr:hypothetical protein [Priestia taiwanensis]MBM7363867.1 hypothetical protein [Priestia taiwanensis]GGE69644.1 hypothetical protein GCM10007140_19600 [Priestia taiwanensis]
MKKNIIFFTSILSVGFLLSACEDGTSSETNTKTEELATAENKIKELEQKINEIENTQGNESLLADINKIHEEEISMYTTLAKEMVKNLNKEEMEELGKLSWHYQLTANKEPTPKNGVIEVDADNIEIELTSRQLNEPVFPLDIHNKGTISDGFEKHITNVEPKPSETSGRDGTVVSSIYHVFSDMESGNTITVTITDELKQRLELETTTITIKRK